MQQNTTKELCYNHKVAYLISYDYLLTLANRHTKKSLGNSARGTFIIDKKEQYHSDIEKIIKFKKYKDTKTHRIKQIVESRYPADSQEYLMIQISDIIVFCIRKFLEIDAKYYKTIS